LKGYRGYHRWRHPPEAPDWIWVDFGEQVQVIDVGFASVDHRSMSDTAVFCDFFRCWFHAYPVASQDHNMLCFAVTVTDHKM